MASRRVSISALLCEDDSPPTSTSPPRVPTHSPDSARQRSAEHHRLDLYREAYPPHPPQPAPPRRTPSPDFPRSSLRTWPPPEPSSRAYNPSQGMFPAVQATSPQLRTSHSHQSQQPPYLPPSPPRPSYSQSPFSTTCLSSDSPASTISLPRPHSIHSPSSPLLYTQRLAPSPGRYYHSPPSSGASQYDPMSQATASPTLRHPRHNSQTEHITSSSVHHTSLSRISTTSSSSFPQALLNPVSPQQSPLGGLEALVEAATVERDRLEASRSSVRRSPELLFRSSHLQAPAPRSPIAPSLISGPIRDSYSESSLRIGPGLETHSSKRQRQSHPYSGPDHSWDPSPSWDSSTTPQFSELMGPGITPRGQSSDVRTEIRPTLPMAPRDKEGASPMASRVSPTRERSVRKQHVTEEKSFRSHVPGYRETWEPVTSASEEACHVLAAEEPRSMARQDLRSHVDSHPPMSKTSRSGMALEMQDTPLSPPPPQVLFTPSKLPAPPAPVPPPRRREDRLSPQAHAPSQTDTPPPATTAFQTLVEAESATGSEKLMDSYVPRAPTPEESSVPQVEPLPPDSLAAVAQDGPLIVASPPTLNTRDVGAADLVKPPSPVLPSHDEADTTLALASPGIRLSPEIYRVSLPPHENILNPPTSEQEACPLPTAASPSPRAVSPSVSNFQDEMRANQPMGDQMSAIAMTGVVALVAESQDPVKTSLTSSGEPEAVNSPVAASIVVEPAPLAMSDSSPRTEFSLIPIINEVKSEPAPELDITEDSKHDQVAEQGQADMDVEEELLSLVADDLPPRSPLTMLRKQGPSSSEDKHTPFHAPIKQESALSAMTSSCPSPTPSPYAIHPDRISKLSPDTAMFVRDSEASMLKLEERPAQKKKTKQHTQPKSRPKPSGSAKTKLKVSSDGPSTAPQKTKKSLVTVTKRPTVTARSRSTSVMPVSTTPAPGALPSAPGEAELEDAEEGMEDKLYCVCKTKYDDESVMIACDRCDEWYHTSCVNMPDLEVDLVDQFICPVCVEKNLHLDLRTTWKRRCLNGLKQHDPNSPDACHKPARGAFSKYCSDECGVQYMHMRISLWVANGGNRDRLWETVKNAERREGVVVSAQVMEGRTRSPGDRATTAIIPPKISKADRELARLRARLETLVQKRETLKAEMDVIAWREKVTELAIQHADAIEQCGWDQRLCFGEEEVAEFGASVLESYEENHAQADVDGAQEEAEWWCMGKKKCDRHSGWQKLRVADVEFDKETKDQALQKLTKLEREIRKRVEDILDPHAHLDKAKILEPSSPRVPVLPRPTVNGQPKHKPNGDQAKKGKKRKE